MNSEWSLDVLYKGFDDPKFSEDLISFEKKAKELDEFSKTLSHENEKEDLLKIVKGLEEFELLEKHLSCFGFLSQSTNTANAKAAAAIDKVVAMPMRFLAMATVSALCPLTTSPFKADSRI